jgi:hypothetical protein
MTSNSPHDKAIAPSGPAKVSLGSLSPFGGANGKNRSTESLDSTSRNGPPRPPFLRELTGISNRSHSSYGPGSLTPNRSNLNLPNSSSASINGDHIRSLRASSTDVLAGGLEEEDLDAEEMRRRAALNRTFILVDFSPTVICLTYTVCSTVHLFCAQCG